MKREKPSALILAGGKSRRFGRDKSVARLGGRSLTATIHETLVQARFDVVVSAGNAKVFSDFSAPVLEDLLPGEGPLQALYGALLKLRVSRLLLVACDMPLLNKNVLKLLWQESRHFDIALLESKEIPSPLPGVYSLRTAPAIEMLLRERRRDLKSLLETDLRVKILPEEIWRPLDPSGGSVVNINTQKDLKEVRCSI